MAYTGDYGSRNFQWANYFHYFGNNYSGSANASRPCIENCFWDVNYFNDLNGSCDEHRRFLDDRGRDAYVVGRANNVSCWFHHTLALQLLEIESAWQSLPLNISTKLKLPQTRTVNLGEALNRLAPSIFLRRLKEHQGRTICIKHQKHLVSRCAHSTIHLFIPINLSLLRWAITFNLVWPSQTAY